MKNTVLTLRERLFSIIRRLGEEPERYARKPGRDFTRKRTLTPRRPDRYYPRPKIADNRLSAMYVSAR